MANPSIAVDGDEPLNVGGNPSAQVSLDDVVVLDKLPEANAFLLGKALNPLVWGDVCGLEGLFASRGAYPIYVGEGGLYPFVPR